MKAKLVRSVKKVAAVATGALFIGATMGMASVFAQGLSSLPGPFVSHGAVNAVVVVGASAAPSDILGSIDIASALTAAAAATHSSTGSFVTVAASILSSTAQTSMVSKANGTAFSAFTPKSATLDKFNFTYGTNSVALKRSNYTAVENITFLKTPEFLGSSVFLPIGSYEISSYVKNVSTGHAAGAIPLMNNLQYLIGNSTQTLINFTAHNFTVGDVNTYSNVKVPSSITLGTHTVNLLGLATVGASPAYEELEFSVNNGGTNYINFTGSGDHLTTAGITITLGHPSLTNTSGTYIPSVSLTSTSEVQNTTNTKNVFGLGAYNFTASALSSASTFLNFTNTANATFVPSFSATSSLGVLGLSNITLEKLSPVYTSGNVENLTVNVGSAGHIILTPAVEPSSADVVLGNTTQALPSVQFGADFRGPLNSNSGISGPDFKLEGYQTYTNLSGTHTAKSEYVFPYNASGTGDAYSYVTYSSGFFTYVNSETSISEIPLLFQLPNGKAFAVQFNVVANTTAIGTGSKMYLANATTLWNGSYSSPQTIVVGKHYSFGGFNVTFQAPSAHTGFVADAGLVINVTGPTSSVTSTTNSAVSLAYNFAPGFSNLYSANGSSYTSAPIGVGGYLGSVSFNGKTLTYTEPITKGTQSVSIVENKSSFFTNISAPTNTSADTYGAYVKGATVHGATFVIPTENYTLALGGHSVTGTKTNYTEGSTLSSVSGTLINIGGVSSISAKGLTSPSISELDSSFAGATNSVPVIVVGGSAINTLGADLLNSSTPVGGATFTTDTGVGSGEALIEMYSSVKAFGNQPALWVAGYGASDTLEASEVLAASLLGEPVVNLTGSKVILSTSSASYTGVTIVTTPTNSTNKTV